MGRDNLRKSNPKLILPLIDEIEKTKGGLANYIELFKVPVPLSKGTVASYCSVSFRSFGKIHFAP